MDDYLMERAKNRDPEVLAQLLVDLAPMMQNTIRRIQPYAQDPENLLGEARAILLEAVDAFDASRGVPFHLYYKKRLEYFLWDDLKRALKYPCVALTEEVLATLLAEENTEEDLLIKERARALHVAVNALPSRERAVIGMHFFCRLSLSEISGRLNLSYQTVANTKTRALKRLRRTYASKQTVDSF
ncbi:MAG: sigma-70 family RNA polymerase sigma factor [Peptoniphilus sp.]|nr:sigma-70 family RNA polymerase sigma factor [Peptoniphilus sp.]MDY3118351.1 sigma-70 family RNA polymerase sigma factor [Peptoniphilus sp.]